MFIQFFLILSFFSAFASEFKGGISPYPEIAQAERFSQEEYFLIAGKPKVATKQKAPSSPVYKPDPTSHLQIGANYTYVNLTPHGFSSFNGNLGGLQALYEFRTWNRIYGAVQFKWRQGKTHGEGTHRSLLDLKTEERIGYSFGSKQANWILSLFSGLGYRHIGQSVPLIDTNFVTDAEGDTFVDFDYNELYIPIGILTDWQVYPTVAFGLYFTWMPQVYPTVKISPLKGSRWILTNQLLNFLIETPITILVSKKYNCTLIFKPFFEYWRDGHSTAETVFGTVLGLPGNTYLFGGIEINFCYSF